MNVAETWRHLASQSAPKPTISPASSEPSQAPSVPPTKAAPSKSISHSQLNIEYDAYGRNIFPLEQQSLSYGGVILEDEVKLEDTGIFKEAGYLSLEMSEIDDLGV